MFTQLPSFQRLVKHLQRMPYLASKNVYKVAMYFLTNDQKTVEQLCSAILEAKKALQPCQNCFNWTEGGNVCSICSSKRRDHGVICVVESWYDLFAMENAGDYQGVYHVLCGALCPLEGIGPDQLTIHHLLKRIDASTKEIILATNPTPEGEATASFISAKIPAGSIHISRLASGMPIGSSLEFMDRVTISKALLGRRPF